MKYGFRSKVCGINTSGKLELARQWKIFHDSPKNFQLRGILLAPVP